ncbi:MAG: YihY/virulence factor BrkB family protein [Polaribacter sp.]|nr:YihY/virulence factor BrkB family protein [Polaribacter sp.]
MSKEIENKLEKIPVLNILVRFGKKIKIPGLQGMSLSDVLEMYIIGIVEGALTTRAGGIAFSFFMAIFPFFLFLLTLIYYIPIDGFQEALMSLMQDTLPPKTYGAVEPILDDIVKNQNKGLLSFGFIASIFLMTNGVNAIFGGFEYSYHVKEVRNIFRAYFISLGTSLVMTFFLVVTVALTILYGIAVNRFKTEGWLDNDFFWIQFGTVILFIFMIFTIVSMLYHYGTKEGKQSSFFSAGAILTTILSIFTFYLFSIYVVEFSKYNELYGSIGTLLILMLFVWLNSIILLLGFELNATLNSLRRKNKAIQE